MISAVSVIFGELFVSMESPHGLRFAKRHAGFLERALYFIATGAPVGLHFLGNAVALGRVFSGGHGFSRADNDPIVCGFSR